MDGERDNSQFPRERPPWPQVLMDDMFLLLALGLAVPTILYIMWGLMDLATVPVFKP